MRNWATTIPDGSTTVVVVANPCRWQAAFAAMAAACAWASVTTGTVVWAEAVRAVAHTARERSNVVVRFMEAPLMRRSVAAERPAYLSRVRIASRRGQPGAAPRTATAPLRERRAGGRRAAPGTGDCGRGRIGS